MHVESACNAPVVSHSGTDIVCSGSAGKKRPACRVFCTAGGTFFLFHKFIDRLAQGVEGGFVVVLYGVDDAVLDVVL